MKKNFVLLLFVFVLLVCPVFANDDCPYQISDFDSLIVNPYNESLDICGDVFQYASFLLPAIFVATPCAEWLTIGVMYAEAFCLTYGTKYLCKSLVYKLRPFMYFCNPPEKYLAENDYQTSFPSGHTAIAFTGAVFTTYLFCEYFPNSKWKIPVIAGSFALATSTAVLRLASGNHFLTDVLVGAAIGTTSGLLIPFLHTLGKKDDSVKFNLLFSGLLVTKKL